MNDTHGPQPALSPPRHSTPASSSSAESFANRMHPDSTTDESDHLQADSGLWSGITRRILLVFAAICVMFAGSSLMALAGLREIHQSLHRVRTHEEEVRTALELGSAVRDQYAHQAHTIILGNDTHLPMYEEARQRVEALQRKVSAQVHGPDERAWATEISTASIELNAIFRGQIVPAVLAGDAATVRSAHAQAQLIVSRIQDRADRIARGAEASIGDFEAHAGVVQHKTFRWLVIYQVAAMLFAILMGIYVGRTIVRPLARLEKGAARIAGGDLTTRISVDTPDEFGSLARQFNAMARALQEHEIRLVQSEKLAAVGRLAAGVAHEINNPIGVILGYVRLMQQKAEGELAEDLKIIHEEAVCCKDIVEGLLDLTRAPRQVVEPIDLRVLTGEVVARLEESLPHPKGHVVVQGAGSIEGNAQTLRQILMNLIKNAIEAAGPTGEVQISISTTLDGWANVVVADSGPGIAGESRARLFEPFFTTKSRGAGLGLAVSRSIAQAHGGSIELGEEKAGGAVFNLHLPTKSEWPLREN